MCSASAPEEVQKFQHLKVRIEVTCERADVKKKSSAKKGPHRTGAARTNYSVLFYFVVFAFDGWRGPDLLLGGGVLFFARAFASFFLLSSARTEAPTLAWSIL